MTTLSSVFIGVPQSQYAGLALLLSILAVSATILFGNDSIPLSQKFGFVLLVFLVSLPSLLMSLFQLTCLVTGAGFKNQRPWCWWYAWIVSGLIMLYAGLLIVAAITSILSKEVPVVKASPARKPDLAVANKMVEQFFMADPASPITPEVAMSAPSHSPSPSPSPSPASDEGGVPEPFSDGANVGASLIDGFATHTPAPSPSPAPAPAGY